MRLRRIGVGVALGLGLLAAGCASILPSPEVRPPPTVDYTVHVLNGTRLRLSITVNGQPFGMVDAADRGDLDPKLLPGLPWSVEARSASGRLILALDVAAGSVVDIRNADGSGSHQAPGARADLSCGRLDIVVGTSPMLGPAPGPGVPGDCVP